jgi:hypothetical protein
MSADNNKYRKKPVVVKAIQFTGEVDNITACVLFCDGGSKAQSHPTEDALIIHTLEGQMQANVGEPDIFAGTYDAVERESGEYL